MGHRGAVQAEVWKALGNRIRCLREAKGWPTQRAFADACGMNSSHLGQIEQGAGNPRLSTFAQITEALNMPISELFRGVF